MSAVIDPERPDVVILDGGQTLWRVHLAEVCEAPCPIHAPSGHRMAGWPLIWRDDRRIFERVCPHGVGHPDPDQRTDDPGVHGCDGCCVEVPS